MPNPTFLLPPTPPHIMRYAAGTATYRGPAQLSHKRPGQQLEAAQRQHADLCKNISGKAVTLYTILLELYEQRRALMEFMR
eukprot:1157891-Pelagomonas_calceolata.AAC.5